MGIIHPQHAQAWAPAWRKLLRSISGGRTGLRPRPHRYVLLPRPQQRQRRLFPGPARLRHRSATTPPAAVPQDPTTGADTSGRFVANHGTCREPLHIPVSPTQISAQCYGVLFWAWARKKINVTRLDYIKVQVFFSRARASEVHSSGVSHN